MPEDEHFKQKMIDDSPVPPNQIRLEQGIDSKKDSR